jgi:hypothetical protein
MNEIQPADIPGDASAQKESKRDERKKPRPIGKAGLLLEMLDDRIDSYQRRREKNRAHAFRLRIAGTVFSAMTTLLLGLQVSEQVLGPTLKNVALCLSVFVTVITAWESFFDYKGLWVKYSKSRAQLLAVRAELDYLLAGAKPSLSDGKVELPDDKVDPLFRQYQSILEETNASWLQLRTAEAHKPA